MDIEGEEEKPDFNKRKELEAEKAQTNNYLMIARDRLNKKKDDRGNSMTENDIMMLNSQIEALENHIKDINRQLGIKSQI